MTTETLEEYTVELPLVRMKVMVMLLSWMFSKKPSRLAVLRIP
jgi:hypothetical protein